MDPRHIKEIQSADIGANEEHLVHVLDGGFVRLVDWMGSDLAIVRSARVSYNADWRAGQDEGSDHRLIAYLMKNRHTTPFESVEFQFEIKAPIFIFRQWHRHRMWSYNELSARYAELDEGFYVPAPNAIGKQSKTNKQARDLTPLTNGEIVKNLELGTAMLEHYKRCHELYKSLLQEGMPRELARSVLPVASYSRMFAKVDLHNLFHFLRLRLDPHAQYEIRVYAEAILSLIENIVPVAVAAFKETLKQGEQK